MALTKSFTFHYELIITRSLNSYISFKIGFTFHYELIITTMIIGLVK